MSPGHLSRGSFPRKRTDAAIAGEMTERIPRSLTEQERRVLEHLLSLDFPGVENLRRQLSSADVVRRWAAGRPSVDLRVPGSTLAAPIPDGPTPVRAIVVGNRGDAVGELLVWVDAGRLDALEYAWYTDDPPDELPSPAQIQLTLEEDHEATRRAVERLFRDVAARFAHATVHTDLPGPPGGKGLMELSCSLPGTTHVRALAGADQVDLYLGQATWLELQPSRRNPGKLLESIRGVVEAVVTGRFEERLREHHGRVIGARSTLNRPDRRPIVWRYSNLGSNALFRGRRRTVRYEPYG
jgi:hypothetical protein